MLEHCSGSTMSGSIPSVMSVTTLQNDVKKSFSKEHWWHRYMQNMLQISWPIIFSFPYETRKGSTTLPITEIMSGVTISVSRLQHIIKEVKWCQKTTLDGNEDNFCVSLPAAPTMTFFQYSDCSLGPMVQALLLVVVRMSCMIFKGWECWQQIVWKLLHAPTQNQPGSSWTPLTTDGGTGPWSPALSYLKVTYEDI